MGPWQIHFSGRTEREAVMEGELTHVSSYESVNAI